MQLSSSTSQIPDGLLAAMTLLSEKPHQGVPSRNLAPHQGIDERNSTAALGLRASEHLNRVWPRYTGKERDSESGNDYMFARYYNSATGRFLSPDWSAKEEPVPYAKLDNPQSLNLYSYVYNNPLGKADPDGHWPAWALAGGGTLEGAEDGAAAGGFLGGPVGAAVGAAIVATAVLLHEIPLPSGPATSVYGTGGCMACAAAATTKGEKPSTLQPGPHAGEGVPARGPDRNFTPEERDKVNKPGVCHTCGTTDPGTKSGNFIPDHQPPNALNPTGGAQRLYPHCIGCSRTQGGEVNAAKPKPPPAPKPKPED
jgi:RHS repeat-associated protein